jgi:hypothetical protein
MLGIAMFARGGHIPTTVSSRNQRSLLRKAGHGDDVLMCVSTFDMAENDPDLILGFERLMQISNRNLTFLLLAGHRDCRL